MRLEAVIFDLDGVITDTAECHYLAWKRLSDELSIPFDRERNQLLRGIGRIESLEIILRNSSATFTREETLQLAERKNVYYRDLIQHLTAKDILPGIERFLQLLREGNIKCGLASASANAPAILRQLHISYLFDYVVDPTLLKAGKPAPDIFVDAARGLGVNAAHCVGVEDAHAGIQAITSAGMFAVGIGTHLADAACDLLLHDTSELTVGVLSAMLEQKPSAKSSCHTFE